MRISDWSSDVCSSDRMAGALARMDAGPEVAPRAIALAGVLLAEFGYHGDTESYDDPQNADLVRVIDRRMGLPVSLGVLYIHAARAQIGRASCGERVCQYV